MYENCNWINQFNNWTVALDQLGRYLDCRELNELEKLGIVHVFEYNHELACKTIASFFFYHGTTGLHDFKDLTRKAFSTGLIDDGEIWMSMIKSRQVCNIAYEESALNEVVDATVDYFYSAFVALHDKLSSLI